jgi:hypothetical protein
MTSAFSGTTPYYNLSRTAHTSAKMSFGSRSAGIVQHFALYASTTGFECLWKVSKRNLIVSMLSSALPEVLPLPNNLSVVSHLVV